MCSNGVIEEVEICLLFHSEVCRVVDDGEINVGVWESGVCLFCKGFQLFYWSLLCILVPFVESNGKDGYLDSWIFDGCLADFEEVVEVCSWIAVKLYVGVVEGGYSVDV